MITVELKKGGSLEEAIDFLHEMAKIQKDICRGLYGNVMLYSTDDFTSAWERFYGRYGINQ